MAETPTPAQQDQNTQNQQGGSALDKFRQLSPRNQMLVGGLILFFVFILFSRGGNDKRPTQAQTQAAGKAAQTQLRDVVDRGGTDESFSGLEVERPELIQNWLQQQQQALANMQESIEDRFVQLEEEKNAEQSELQNMRSEIRQMIQTFQAEIRSLEDSNQRDREVLGQLAEETRKLQLQSPVQNTVIQQQRPRSKRITQTPLGSGPRQGVALDSSNAPLAGVVRTVDGARGGNLSNRNLPNGASSVDAAAEALPKQPFIPPLGFIKGTLLNGVDALAGGGISTPALVRLSGKYKTAMNSTVNLSGCFVLVEFEGDISTERALGKPSRMTCVYPDRGAVTYDVSGYVVDVNDGIIGVPGIFYEGNASRLAIAMAADFAAGVAEIINSNQSTTTVNSDGTQVNTITGDQTRAEISGGAAQAISSLRDYLFERANRILPFVRIDATREIHMVFLSGTDLRNQGSAWTLLFDASDHP